MGTETKIEWTTHTFNPWLGCTKVSAACDHCYAEAWAKRSGLVEWGAAPRRLTNPETWRKPLAWNRAAAKDKVRRKVFCASLADVFDNKVPPEWRAMLWDLIAECRHLDWLLLTKRPQNIAKMLPSETLSALGVGTAWPWPHVWLGTTVENQEEADRRIPHLLAVPATVHFLSCEPLLGPVDLTHIPFLTGDPRHKRDALTGDGLMYGEGVNGHPDITVRTTLKMPRLDWIICGGESGGGARPMRAAWAQSLRDQCATRNVAFFLKQWGDWIDADALTDRINRHAGQALSLHRCTFEDAVRLARGRPLEHQSDGTTMIRVGKHEAGHELDGRIWHQFPDDERIAA